MKILFTNVTAVTMDEAGSVLQNACVLVEGETISYVGQSRPEGEFAREIDCVGRVMMPGLINAHTHLPMTLMRGYGGGCALQSWLSDYIFPAEEKLDGRSVKAGTELALAELIAGGVTCVADMYYFCADIAQAVAQSGLSANISRSLAAFEPTDTPQALPSWREMRELLEEWHGFGKGQILVDASIHAEYTSFAAPRLWEKLAFYAADRKLGIQVHISETEREHQECVSRHGKTPIALFDSYDLWRGRGVAAHCVYVTEEDMALMRERRITAVHNPISNLKLASGIAPVPKMLERGVNVALGTDGVASNNSHDMFEEIKAAALLHKGLGRDASAVTARQALAMATRNGAAALGRNTGVIAPGKIADIILLDFTRPGLTPCHNVEENLVFSARGSDVVMNMARGQVIYEHGTFYTLDVERIRHEVEAYALPRIFG